MTFARGCYGWLVEEIQVGLNDKGIQVAVDGVFGPKTEEAVKKWQDRHGFIPNGRVTDSVWVGITSDEYPSLFERCAQLTAAFEGMKFNRVVEHKDVGIGYGFLTFSLKWGHIKKILLYAFPFDEAIVATSPCGEQRFRYLVNVETPDSEFEAEVLGNKKAWMQYLAKIDTRDAQIEYTYDAIWNAVAAKDRARLLELGVSDGPRLWGLCFDHAVQSGGLTDAEVKSFLTLRRTRIPELMALAHAMADHAKREYRDDVLSRRAVFAMGSGVVHKKNYLTLDWGIDRLDIAYAGTQGQETADIAGDSGVHTDRSSMVAKIMEFGETNMLKSKTVWTGAIAVVTGVLAIFGVIPGPVGLDNLTPENQQLVGVITQVVGWAVSLIGGLGIFQRLGTAKVEKKLKEIASE